MDCGLQIQNTPSKSSLAELRSKVSFKFFEDTYSQQLCSVQRKKFKGLYIYAVDGDQLDLPASEDIIKNGFRGYPTSKNRETHYPKMYTVQSYDIVNQLITNFKYSNVVSESVLASDLVKSFEKDSVSIYDRLYCGYLTFASHVDSGNYFIVRARIDGSGVNKDVLKFKNSNKKSSWIIWKPSARYRVAAPSFNLRLVKFKNERTGKDIIFITNVPDEKLTDREIGTLYQRRWGIESSFKDLTCTLKLNQFHSKSLNGILQEIYALLWFVNTVKAKIASHVSQSIMETQYRKSNFKLCSEIIMTNLRYLIQKKEKLLEKILQYWINRTVESRKHLSRNYPRAVRLRGRSYVLMNVVPRRLTERH